jgi:hypothetical protein
MRSIPVFCGAKVLRERSDKASEILAAAKAVFLQMESLSNWSKTQIPFGNDKQGWNGKERWNDEQSCA